MRWPDDDSVWTKTEEDWCETSSLTSCTSFLHYGSTGTDQIYHAYSFDQTQWHTTRYSRVGYVVKAYLDGILVWSFTGDASNTTTGVPKHVVLQQEQAATPTSTSATEEILV